ncbi:MAG: hypothetical protein ACFFDN_48520 [Candidatus Hodarchaeota archaeon]
MNDWDKDTISSTIKIIAIYFLVIVFILILIGFGTGYIQVLYNKTIGVELQDSKREINKESKSYVEGMIADLSKYYSEYESLEDETAKKSIQNRIINDFANFDSSKIENALLKKFLIEMRGF